MDPSFGLLKHEGPFGKSKDFLEFNPLESLLNVPVW